MKFVLCVLLLSVLVAVQAEDKEKCCRAVDEKITKAFEESNCKSKGDDKAVFECFKAHCMEQKEGKTQQDLQNWMEKNGCTTELMAQIGSKFQECASKEELQTVDKCEENFRQICPSEK